jgi:propionyl-CoA carboxylase alpha chain
MGDKIESKKLAQEAGVSQVPGYLGVVKDGSEAAKIAGELGYPVMIKASAGGGGKGMRIAFAEPEVEQAFRSASNEARSAFGDERVFIEKYIVEPRHIEIQVLGDKHGTVIHLGERECSIQRRHQKVIEEAPSPFLDAKTRQAMGAQAVALAKAVKYHSAGTVEFIVDAERRFYFLEMNTRLQVEHPVTELVTGIDLVEQMIRVAAGEKLAIKQADVQARGWAVEARIYAEDPYRGFLPSTGRLKFWRPPADSPHVRVDTGVEEGSEITRFYDPMIAKMCAWGENRAVAIDRLSSALDETRLAGISHNVNFLAALARHRRFREGRLSTAFIADEWPQGFHGAELSADDLRAVAAVATFVQLTLEARAARIAGRIANGRPPAAMERIARMGEQSFRVAAEAAGADGVTVTIDERPLAVQSSWHPGEALFRGRVQGVPFSALVAVRASDLLITHGGAQLAVAVRTPRGDELARLMPVKVAPDLSRFLLCPMPGLVVSVNVNRGEAVKAGQTLAVVEAMKMENVLRAERDGVIGAIKVKAGDSLAVDQVILEFEN